MQARRWWRRSCCPSCFASGRTRAFDRGQQAGSWLGGSGYHCRGAWCAAWVFWKPDRHFYRLGKPAAPLCQTKAPASCCVKWLSHTGSNCNCRPFGRGRFASCCCASPRTRLRCHEPNAQLGSCHALSLRVSANLFASNCCGTVCSGSAAPGIGAGTLVPPPGQRGFTARACPTAPSCRHSFAGRLAAGHQLLAQPRGHRRRGPRRGCRGRHQRRARPQPE